MNSDSSTEKPGGGTASLYWAILLILVGLIFMTASHIKAIREHTTTQVEKNRKDTELLEKAGDRARQTEKLIDALRKLALTNTTAARIMEDFFPPSAPQLPEFHIKKE